MLVIDIETASDNLDAGYEAYKLATMTTSRTSSDKIREQFPISPLTGKIILIGLLTQRFPELDEKEVNITKFQDGHIEYSTAQIGLFPNGQQLTEKRTLEIFWRIIQHVIPRESGLPLVSFNGKGFDLPYILIRSLINQVDIPLAGKGAFTKWNAKYTTDFHVDMRSIFNNYDNYARGTLDEYAYRMGLTQVMQGDSGADVPIWYNEGKFNQILQKNMLDVNKTFRLYEKIERLL